MMGVIDLPDVSIVIKSTDRFSDAIKTMSNSAKSFSKDMDGMQSKLNALNKTKATLKVDVDKAKAELKAAEKQFAATGDVVDQLALQSKQLTFEEARRNLALVSKEAANVEKQMLKTGDAFSKSENKASGGLGSQMGSALKTIAAAGGIKMIGDAASQWANTLVSSAGGSDIGTIFSSALSGAASGAAMGSLAGPVTAAIGAAIGGGVGLLNGGNQVFQKQDEIFKSYVQDAYDTVVQEQSGSLTTGSAIAAGRETDRISFATLFGNAGIADTYLANLVEMSNNTPFLYDDLTAMSKTLATYKYGADEILPVLQTIGDAGAALGMSTSDMTMVATALGRMKSSNKTSLEYLNILNDRGIGVFGMLSEAYGVDQGKMYDMISKGKIKGTKAAEIILQAMTDSFVGSMEAQSKTFSGLTSTVDGLTQELYNAMGEGFNKERMPGLQAQRDWLSGESGKSMKDAYSMIGQWKASLENTKEQMEREAMDAVMTGTLSDTFQNSAQGSRLSEMAKEYQEALTEYEKGNAEAGNKMGSLLAEAQVIAFNEYNASDGAKLALESEKSLIKAIRDDTSLNDDYWHAGYEKGQEFTKGLAAVMALGETSISPERAAEETERRKTLENLGLYAVGIDYVPYDNFPALLHQGERVQTAVEARSEKAMMSVRITGNNFTIREDADVDRVASTLLQKIELAGMRA